MKLVPCLSLLILAAMQPGCARRVQLPSVPVAAQSLSLSAGSTLALMTAQAIDSSSDPLGRTYAVVVSRDAGDVAGQTILPSGSPATLTLLRAAGAQPGMLELKLASVMLNGDSYLVRTDTEADNPAVLGTSLGTFLGGVPGSRNFPLSPKAPSTPVLITMTADRIVVPVGSLLTFRLSMPLRLVGSR